MILDTEANVCARVYKCVCEFDWVNVCGRLCMNESVCVCVCVHARAFVSTSLAFCGASSKDTEGGLVLDVREDLATALAPAA